MRIFLPLARGLVFVSSLLCEELCTPIQKTEEFLSISSISTPVSLLAVSDIETAFNYSETILRRDVDRKTEFSVSKGSSLSWKSLSLKIFQVSYILTFTLKQPNRRINKVWNNMGRGAEIRAAHSPRLNYKAESDPTWEWQWFSGTNEWKKISTEHEYLKLMTMSHTLENLTFHDTIYG